MDAPVFLSLEQVIELQDDLIVKYGGSPGIRDMDLLNSAIGTPMATFGGEFLHTDIYEMAAAYLYHLTSNHAFIDGNKRIGGAAAAVFLHMNGLKLTASEPDYAELVLGVARGELKKTDVTIFLRKSTTAR